MSYLPSPPPSSSPAFQLHRLPTGSRVHQRELYCHPHPHGASPRPSAPTPPLSAQGSSPRRGWGLHLPTKPPPGARRDPVVCHPPLHHTAPRYIASAATFGGEDPINGGVRRILTRRRLSMLLPSVSAASIHPPCWIEASLPASHSPDGRRTDQATPRRHRPRSSHRATANVQIERGVSNNYSPTSALDGSAHWLKLLGCVGRSTAAEWSP